MPDEIDIDLLERLEEYNKILEGAGFSKLQREDLLRKYKEYDTELEGKSYEQLARIYKEVYKDTVDYEIMGPDVAEGRFKHIEQKTLRSSLDEEETVDTPDELRAEVRELMRNRDFGRVFEQNLKYDKEFEEEGLDTYEELAEYYKRVWKLVHKGTPSENDLEGKNLKDLKNLDTYGELREQTRELMEQHDKLPGPGVRIEKVEEVKPEAGASSVKPTWWWGTNEEEVPPVDKPEPDASSVKPDTADENALRAAPAAAGDDEIHVHHTHRVTSEQLKEYNKQLEGEGLSKSQREGLLRKYKEYDTELEDKSYEELVSIYKEVYKDAGGYWPDIAEEVFDLLEQKSARTALNQWEVIDTPEELRAEVRELMRARDFDRVLKLEIETPPDSDEQAGADAGGGEIKQSYDFADAAADAKAAAREAAAAADAGDDETEKPPESARRPTGSEAAPIEGNASSRLMGGGASPIEDLRDEAFSGEEEGEGAPHVAAALPAEAAEGVEIEMPPDYVGRAGAEAAAQEPNNAPDPWGVAASPEELGQDTPATDPWAGMLPPGTTEQAGAEAAEGVEIEMPPAYVGQAGADAGGVETEMPLDPAETETPPEDHVDEVL